MKSVNFFYNFSYRIKFHYILDTTINYDQILYQFSWYRYKNQTIKFQVQALVAQQFHINVNQMKELTFF